jgi:hypothetical protein
MKAIKIRLIAYIALGIINLFGFVYLVGGARYHVSAETPQYDEGAPSVPLDLSSWFSRRP